MSDADQEKYSWGALFPQALPKYVPSGFRFKEDVPNYEEKPPADKLYEPYLTEAIPKYWIHPDNAAAMADLQLSIRDFLVQKVAEWVSGQEDIEADWDNYLAQLDRLKVKDYIDLRLKSLNQ